MIHQEPASGIELSLSAVVAKGFPSPEQRGLSGEVSSAMSEKEHETGYHLTQQDSRISLLLPGG